MALIQALSVASIILGIYIIGIFFFGQEQQQPRYRRSYNTPQFHLGCFLTEHNLSHSKRIQKFLIDSSKVYKTTRVHSTNQLANNLFDDKALQVAKVFQIFLQEYNVKRLQMKNYKQLFKTTRSAFQEYEYCAQVIKNGQNFQETQCKNTWVEFQNCSMRLQILKNELLSLLDRKLQVDFRMKELLFNMNTQQKQKKNQTKQLQNQYYMKEKELGIQIKTLENYLRILKQKISITQYSYTVAKNETLHTTFVYKQCVESRRQFMQCQQLSKQVRSLGHVTLEGLWSKVERKRYYIIKIQKMVNNQQQNQERRRYQGLKNKNLDQYKKLHRLYIQTKAKMNKSCGCTQEQEQKLFENLQVKIKNQQQLSSQLASYQKKIMQQTRLLNILEQKKPLLLKEFQQKLKNIQKSHAQEISSEDIIKKITIEKEEINKKITFYETKFNDLTLSCDSNRNELSSYVNKISFICDCRLKKDFYLRLNQSLKKQEKRLNLQFDSKNRLIQALKDFKLPSL